MYMDFKNENKYLCVAYVFSYNNKWLLYIFELASVNIVR